MVYFLLIYLYIYLSNITNLFARAGRDTTSILIQSFPSRRRGAVPKLKKPVSPMIYS